MTGASAQDEPVVGQLTLRYWAAARAATGVIEEAVPVSGATSLAAVIAAAIARHSSGPGGEARVAGVLRSCSVLLGDLPVGTADPEQVQVRAGQTIEFLPPFAGG